MTLPEQKLDLERRRCADSRLRWKKRIDEEGFLTRPLREALTKTNRVHALRRPVDRDGRLMEERRNRTQRGVRLFCRRRFGTEKLAQSERQALQRSARIERTRAGGIAAASRQENRRQSENGRRITMSHWQVHLYLRRVILDHAPTTRGPHPNRREPTGSVGPAAAGETVLTRHDRLVGSNRPNLQMIVTQCL